MLLLLFFSKSGFPPPSNMQCNGFIYVWIHFRGSRKRNPKGWGPGRQLDGGPGGPPSLLKPSPPLLPPAPFGTNKSPRSCMPCRARDLQWGFEKGLVGRGVEKRGRGCIKAGERDGAKVQGGEAEDGGEDHLSISIDGGLQGGEGGRMGVPEVQPCHPGGAPVPPSPSFACFQEKREG